MSSRIEFGPCVRTALLVISLGLFLAAPARATLITLDWAPPNPVTIGPGATSLTVDLLAVQTDEADAAAVTLGFTLGGIVTDISLVSFGAAVSASDSFFGATAGEILLIAVAPSSPGSFGTDVNFTVATFNVTLDTSLGGAGSLSLKDLTSFAGPPALEIDGFTVVPSDISASFNVVVPEPSTAILFGTGLLGLAGNMNRRRRARAAAARRPIR